MKKPIPFGKYYLLERINVGGMAEVFRAKAFGVEGFERLVAVKRILPNIAEDYEFITMFIDEAKIAVQLNHANIAQIFDLGVVDGSYFIALEHVFGRDLRAIFDRCRHGGEPMTVAQACFTVMKICEALDYAHNKRDAQGREMNLVHRDVSPQNVLVSFEGEVKIVDFGIAKAAGKAGKTQAGILKGKFGYMSPEQVRGLPIDRRSDIFATGIVLYELLTNERLFTGESDFSTLEKVRNVEILPPSTYNRKIPEELERIVLKALAADVDDRYQNAIDLHDELQAFVYTAGEFYSRKDLAAWTKRVFAKEIEEETAKLEQYRALVPPPEVRPPAAQRSVAAPAGVPRRQTMALPTVAPPPPPPPDAVGASDARESARPGWAPAAMPSPAMSEAGEDLDGATANLEEGLDWDEDELETQIYDHPAAAAAAAEAAFAEPEVVAATADMTEVAAVELQPQASARTGTRTGTRAKRAASAMQAAAQVGFDDDLKMAPVPPVAEKGRTEITPPPVTPIGSGPRRATDIMPSVGEIPTDSPGLVVYEQAARRGGRRALAWWLALIGCALLAGSAVGAMLVIKSRRQIAPPGFVAADGGVGDHAIVMAGTAILDVITDPVGAEVTVDGSSLGPAPCRAALAAGQHLVVVGAAPGFLPKTQAVDVEPGRPGVVTIRLEAMEIFGEFVSDPPGARVTLVAGDERQRLGLSPIKHELDPRKRYEAVFEREGFATEIKPVAIDGNPLQRIAVVMRKVTLARPGGGAGTGQQGGGQVAPVGQQNQGGGKDGTPPRGDGASKTGFLSVGAMPPCKIYIDGRDTGLFTPQRRLEVPAGSRKITLVNAEFGIKEGFSVEVQAGQEQKLLKRFGKFGEK
ncbi:MAG: serine/threonine-protein kinase [Pseudomonadota bacterium]